MYHWIRHEKCFLIEAYKRLAKDDTAKPVLNMAIAVQYWKRWNLFIKKQRLKVENCYIKCMLG